MNKILIGLDGSPNSFKALEEAINIAKLNNAELHTISVEELPQFPETVGEIEEENEFENSKYSKFIIKAKETAKLKNFKLESHLLVGHEVKTIIEFIKKYKFDLLVIGFMGNSAVYERVMGSTCQSLVRMAPCSVFVVK